MKHLTREQADAVYQILVEECGATTSEKYARWSFSDYMSDVHTIGKEWRFMGTLGMGGNCKLNDNHDYPYVVCYSEDETPERLAAINRANKRLAAMFRVTDAPPVVLEKVRPASPEKETK